MEIILKTLTPLHIGNGEALRPIDYIINDSVLYRVSQKQLLNFIKENSLISEFEVWINRKTDEIDSLKTNINNIDSEIRNLKRNNEKDLVKRKENSKKDFNRQLNELDRSINLKSFLSEISDSLLKKFIENEKPTKFILKFEINNQIRGFIKSPTNKPYLPGTSLKGAIRTALLYKYLKDFANIQEIKKIIEDLLSSVQKDKSRLGKEFKPDKYKKTFADKIEQLVFYCETKDQNGRRKKDDEKFDIMKFLFVSDGILQKDDLTLANIDLYLLTKKKDKKPGRIEIVAEKQPQAPCVEAIPPDSIIKTEIDFNIQFFLSIKDKFDNNAIKQGKDLIWIDLKDKVKNVFNLDIDTLRKENIEEKKEEVLSYIFSAINEFSNAQLKAERIWIKEFSEKDRNKTYSNKINSGFKKLFDHKGTLIHLGFASGFNGITEFLYLKPNPELKELFKEVMEFFLIGDRPGAKHTEENPYIANPDKFPKSRRLTELNNSLEPLGWLQLFYPNENKDSYASEETTASNQVSGTTKEIIPQFRDVKIKAGTLLDAFVLKNGDVEVYMPDETKKIVKLVSGKAEPGKVIEVAIYPDKKGNFNQASFKGYKK